MVVRDVTKRNSETLSELTLLRALIDRWAGSSPPSLVDVERGLESGLGRLMMLEVQRREQASRASRTRHSERMRENDDLVEQIRALREAVTELRACTDAGESTPLAQGFIIPRPRGLRGTGYPLVDGSAAAAGVGWRGRASQTAGARCAG